MQCTCICYLFVCFLTCQLLLDRSDGTVEVECWIDNYDSRNDAENADLPRGSIVLNIDSVAELCDLFVQGETIQGFELRSAKRSVKMYSDMDSAQSVSNTEWVSAITDIIRNISLRPNGRALRHEARQNSFIVHPALTPPPNIKPPN